MSCLPQSFLSEAEGQFSLDFLLTDAESLAIYGKDCTKVFTPSPGAVALPRSTEEVARLLALCVKHRVAVVPSGGRTGLAGGAVALAGEVVLSLQRMRRMDAVDVLGETVRVQAGAVTEAVHQHCAGHGLTWPVDFASKGSSHVGGNIATNAGGVKVIRYGLTRQWVLGLQVVLASGEVLELNGALEKNNTGLDLRQLFIGSEGILGVITEATLKLTRVPRALQVMLFAVQDLDAVLTLFKAARRGPFQLMAYEFFTDVCYQRLARHRKLKLPFAEAASHYVLVEVENFAAESLEAWTASLFENELVLDGVVASTTAQGHELWTLREGISESLSATGMPHKNDIALPITQLTEFCSELDAFFAAHYPGWEICLFGHIGDGNLHLNVMKPDAMSKEDFLRQTHAADDDIFALVRKYNGSISAEHGIGLLKRDYLHYSRKPEEIALIKALKKTLDPHNILNPGKVIAP